MSEDLPTFGMPIIIARAALGLAPCLVSLCVLSSAKYFADAINSFIPVPNVDSAVISLDKKDDYKINDFDKFEKLLKAAFQYKRKNLRNNLKEYDLDKITNILNKYNLSLSDRAEDVNVEVFIEIANNI